jgi:hypothetical protein
MVAALALLEIEFRIALLPPITRGAALCEANPARVLAGPWLHADRLIDIWKVDDGERVPLAQAWRLLDLEAVHGAILRTLAASEEGYTGDPRYWHFPPLTDLLLELRECSWQAMLAGELEIEAIRGVQAKTYRGISPLELPRLVPDWELSRLVRDGEGVVLLEVRVRRRSTEPIKTNWRGPILRDELKVAAEAIAQEYAPGTRLSESDFWARLKDRTERSDLPRQVARNAFDEYAPQLKIPPGYHPPKSK